MALAVSSFQASARSSAVCGDTGLHDGVRVHANLIQVVPDHDNAVVRLTFTPQGSFVADRYFLSRPLRVLAVGGSEILDEKFEAGETMPAEGLDIQLGDGDVGEFPFDEYDAQVQVRVVSPTGEPVPSVLVGEASVHGYRFTVTSGLAEPNRGNNLNFAVRRAPTTVAFAIFIDVLMWALAALALTMALGEIRSAEEIDGAAITLLGVLLFAFPAVRNSVPNMPSLGVLSDYLSYFWCEIGLGLGLVSLLIFNIRRQRRARQN